MGLFSSKKKTYRVSAAQRLLDDDNFKLSRETAAFEYIFGKDTSGYSILDYILEAKESSLPSKFEKAYRYAKKDTTIGLPKAKEINPNSINYKLSTQNYLKGIYGSDIEILYIEGGEVIYSHFLWKILIDSYNYSPITNSLNAPNRSNVKLKSAVIYYSKTTEDVVIDPTFYDQLGLSTEYGKTFTREEDFNREVLNYETDALSNIDYVKVTYEYKVPDTIPPNIAKTKGYIDGVLKGVAELGSTVKVTTDNAEYLTTADASTGAFTIEVAASLVNDPSYTPTGEAGEIIPQIEVYPEVINVVVIDANGLQSAINQVTLGYSTDIDLGIGDTPTQEIFEDTFEFNFLEYAAMNLQNAAEENEEEIEVPEEHRYIMAGFFYKDSGGTKRVGYLTYQLESNTIAELELNITGSDRAGEFYPRIYTRLNYKKLNESWDKDDPRRKYQEKLAKQLNMNWSELIDQLDEGMEDKAHIPQCYIGLAAPVNTKDEVISEYVYRFFSNLLEGVTELTTENIIRLKDDTNFEIKVGRVLDIADNIYTHRITYSGISDNLVDGILSDGKAYEITYQPSTSIRLSALKYIKTSSFHRIKYQITPTKYREIRVYGLNSINTFEGGSTTINDTDENLVIPLDRSILPKMTQDEKEILFNKCLYCFINFKKTVKVKWYQRGIFKVVMFIVAAVITYFFPPAGAAAWTALQTAAYAVAAGVAVSVAVTVLSKLLIKVGIDAKIVMAIAVIVTIVYGGAKIGNVGTVLNVSANTLLQFANIAYNIVSKMSQYMLQSIQKQLQEFQKEAADKQEILDQAKALLDSGGIDLDGSWLIENMRKQSLMKYGETVEDYFNRTINLNNNVGTLGYNIIENYVDIVLTLPTISDTLSKSNQFNSNLLT